MLSTTRIDLIAPVRHAGGRFMTAMNTSRAEPLTPMLIRRQGEEEASEPGGDALPLPPTPLLLLLLLLPLLLPALLVKPVDGALGSSPWACSNKRTPSRTDHTRHRDELRTRTERRRRTGGARTHGYGWETRGGDTGSEKGAGPRWKTQPLGSAHTRPT